jgi:hypothetical protein
MIAVKNILGSDKNTKKAALSKLCGSAVVGLHSGAGKHGLFVEEKMVFSEGKDDDF